MISELKNYAWDATKAVSCILDIEYRLNPSRNVSGAKINSQTHGDIGYLLNKLNTIATDLDLVTTKSQLISISLETVPALNVNRALTLLELARATFVTELKSRFFLPASANLVGYTGKKLHFGEAVAQVFPECSEDITEAHECFGFGRYTACAFHIGRVMELAVARLARRMSVPKRRPGKNTSTA